MGGVRKEAVYAACLVQDWTISAVFSVAEWEPPPFVGGAQSCMAGCSNGCSIGGGLFNSDRSGGGASLSLVKKSVMTFVLFHPVWVWMV